MYGIHRTGNEITRIEITMPGWGSARHYCAPRPTEQYFYKITFSVGSAQLLVLGWLFTIDPNRIVKRGT